ncbi:hypothetical protein SPND141_00920 [Streptococcus pneumoniae]|nr:hypothetical protein SPND141_00920 [Streptococcus pneumoniae]
MFIFYPQLLYLFIIPYFRSFPKRKKNILFFLTIFTICLSHANLIFKINSKK